MYAHRKGHTLFWPRDTLQFEAVQKFRAATSNICHSLVEGQGAMVMAKDMRNLQVTSCPTYSDLFEHFDKGLYKRIGDVARPDHALLHAILQEIRQGLMDRAWSVVAERDNLE